MLFVAGVHIKSYWSVFVLGEALAVSISCPAQGCSGVVCGHGWHRRYLGGVLVWLRRVRCRVCGVSHVILPEEVCAGLDLTLVALEQVVAADGPTAAARQVGLSGEEGKRRARRWRRQVSRSLASQVRALLPASPGSWWDGVLAVAGAAPGVLVRLRSWLWSKYRLLLAGVTGLLRGGRPRQCVRGHSPDLGICPGG